MSYNDKYPDMSAMYAVQFEYENKLKDKIKELETELERTRKALAFAKSKLNGIHRLYSKAFYTREDWLQVCMEMVDKANTALEQITALEQKDVK